jgi:hypothetical protein
MMGLFGRRCEPAASKNRSGGHRGVVGRDYVQRSRISRFNIFRELTYRWTRLIGPYFTARR